ncbi:2-amino-4-hydroxy-6-hydroxymethyldihydropteridine diphosphokinase [Afifella pfennigii]|uniref:2-amino-4-hydroxy-6- hydroxymethyldihydropteridine diphosphokinase n=1 Tax=Afifella pfennigii TaxID=209897 RepID=UPI0005567717|nr:2-amino-4-hydroxy-6-hydroxymethyldihydropteridine diphosphokinase [Afifella pfennigii]
MRGVRAVLGLGGNLGEPAEAFRQAAALLQARDAVKVLASAPIYASAPWGMTDQPDFLNSALLVETTLSPRGLLETILGVERQLGRVRETRWGPRAIDIDILVYGETEVEEAGLAIPHPFLAERAFALKPLCDLWPQAPVRGRPALAWLAELEAAELRPVAPAGWHLP